MAHADSVAASASPEIIAKKRKRSSLPAEEVEIDINLPEPPSKKALRKAKKSKSRPSAADDDDEKTGADKSEKVKQSAGNGDKTLPSDSKTSATDEQKRSNYGIWIGNLAFAVDKASLKTFLSTHGSISEDKITRIHLPMTIAGAGRPTGANQQRGFVNDSNDKDKDKKPLQNKGFAYIDFIDAETLAIALTLSETLLSGRKVLIKDSKSFAGRPDPSTTNADGIAGGKAAGNTRDGKTGFVNGKAPSKRIFVGNLSFDVTKDDLEEHFAQAGSIEGIHLATFEDSGKCKGFAWVTFGEITDAEKAVRGFVFKNDEAQADDDDDEEDEAVKEDDATDVSDDDGDKKKKNKTKKKAKPRKWFINRLFGRPLRCEFAEDASVRYKKRFGKGAAAGGDARRGADESTTDAVADGAENAGPEPAVEGRTERKKARPAGDKDQRQEMRRKKHVDARSIRPGAALANAPRASGAIVEGTGKKTTFE